MDENPAVVGSAIEKAVCGYLDDNGYLFISDRAHVVGLSKANAGEHDGRNRSKCADDPGDPERPLRQLGQSVRSGDDNRMGHYRSVANGVKMHPSSQKALRLQGFFSIGAPRFELGTSSPPD